MLSGLCPLEKLLLDLLLLLHGLLDLLLSLSSIVLSFFSFLLGLLDNLGGSTGSVLLRMSRSNGFLLNGLGLLGLFSSSSTCLADSTVVLDVLLSEVLLSFMDELLSLDDLGIDSSQFVSHLLLDSTFMGKESLSYS